MLSKTPATIKCAQVSGSVLIAIVALFACAANAAQVSVMSGTQFTTTTGAPIQAHGGGVIKVGPYYYWFGENRNPNSTFFAVSCYRSTDLKNWEFRNNVLTANSSAELNPANIERPKVVYNSNTGRYVMWMHWENGVHYGEARAAVASSATVDGNYTYHGSFRPYANSGVVDHGKPGYMSRDCTLFVDTDGIGYFISAANENADLHVYRLTGDYLGIDILVVKLWVGQKREAPAMFKRNGYYFLVTSGPPVGVRTSRNMRFQPTSLPDGLIRRTSPMASAITRKAHSSSRSRGVRPRPICSLVIVGLAHGAGESTIRPMSGCRSHSLRTLR